MQQQIETVENHRDAEDLAPGRHSIGTEIDLRLAEELADAAGTAIADQENATQRAGAVADLFRACAEMHQDEQQQAFQCSFIELARMPRFRPGLGKDHRPGHISGATPELAIDEIGDPAEAEADRRRAGDHIGDSEEAELLAAPIEIHGSDDAEEAAMEGHAAFPDLEGFQRLMDIVFRMPEQYLAQPAAEDDAYDDPGDEIIELFALESLRRQLDEAQAVPPAEQNAGDVGKRVPADIDRPQMEGDGIEIREDEIAGGIGCHVRLPVRSRGSGCSGAWLYRGETNSGKLPSGVKVADVAAA